jgi:3',5'-cyclic AMP phosphodiesterase CpdA
MRIVQISDLHLQSNLQSGGIDPWAALAMALTRLAGLRAEALLISGDIAEAGDLGSYTRLASTLAGFSGPLALLPGNHDQRAALFAAFPGHWDNPEMLCRRLDLGPLTLLLLDSLVPGQPWGEIGEAQLGWLDANCPERRRSIVVLHHPPFAVGIPGMDEIGCRGGEALANWLLRRPQVEAVWCGHVHRPVFTVFAGKMAVTAPSTVHQIALQDGPLSWTPEAPGLLVHDLLPGVPVRSHYLPLQAAPVVAY